MAKPQKSLVMKNKTRDLVSGQAGVVAIVTAIAIMAFFALAALAVDLGHLYMGRAELQRAVDAGAIAGARSIFPYPLQSATVPVVPQCAAATAKAAEIAQSNLVDGSSITVTANQTGAWNWATSVFTSGCSANPFTNAVQLTTSSANISMMFLGILGMAPVALQATATAVKDWVSQLPQGAGFVLAIHRNYAGNGQVLTIYYNSPIVQGAWCYKSTSQNPTDARLIAQLNNTTLIPSLRSRITGPPLQLGENVRIDYGNFSNTATNIINNYINKIVWCPVIGSTTRRTSTEVLGFTAFKITAVNNTSNPSTTRYIQGTALSLAEVPARTGNPATGTPDPRGNNYGLLTATKLVK
jgi:Flp pilus assembly protein TadG